MNPPILTDLAKLAALIAFAVWVAVAILHYGALPR